MLRSDILTTILVFKILMCVFLSWSIIPKYFPLVHGSTFCSLIWKLRWFVILLFFARKIIISALIIFNIILFALHNLFINWCKDTFCYSGFWLQFFSLLDILWIGAWKDNNSLKVIMNLSKDLLSFLFSTSRILSQLIFSKSRSKASLLKVLKLCL